MADEVVITEYTEETADYEEEMSSGWECRICLQTTQSGSPLSTQIQFHVANQQTELTLQQMMVLICIVKIDGKDEERRPQSLCEDCKDGLTSAYRLRLIAQNTDRVLTDRLINVDKVPKANTLSLVGTDTPKEENMDSESGPETDPKIDKVSPKKRVKPDFLCNVCGRNLPKKSALERHMQSHSSEKPFSCEHCPSKFANQYTLKTHQVRHTGARPFICDMCGKAFPSYYVLTTHLMSHTGERPYACEICGKGFAAKSHLRRHTRMHTGERHYKCTHCDRAFYDKDRLTEHLRRHVGESMYKCDQCPVSFKYRRELRSHLEEHFRETKATT